MEVWPRTFFAHVTRYCTFQRGANVLS